MSIQITIKINNRIKSEKLKELGEKSLQLRKEKNQLEAELKKLEGGQ